MYEVYIAFLKKTLVYNLIMADLLSVVVGIRVVAIGTVSVSVVGVSVSVGVVAVVSTIVASLSIGLRCSLGISAPESDNSKLNVVPCN